MNRNVLLTNTAGLVAMCKDSEGRNRGPNKAFYRMVDPHGVHVCVFKAGHGFGRDGQLEHRALWLCKIRNRVEPISLWIDCRSDVLDRHAYTPQEFDAAFPGITYASTLMQLCGQTPTDEAMSIDATKQP